MCFVMPNVFPATPKFRGGARGKFSAGAGQDALPKSGRETGKVKKRHKTKTKKKNRASLALQPSAHNTHKKRAFA